MNKKIYDYYGTEHIVTCDDKDAFDVIVDTFIKPFMDDLCQYVYAVPNGNLYGSVQHAQNYVGYITSVLLSQCGSGDAVSERTMRRHRQMEVPFDSVENVKPVEKKPSGSKKIKTKIDKMEDISKEHAGAVLRWWRVDVDGSFYVDGEHYRVIDSKYGARRIKGFGTYYQFDRILTADWNEGTRSIRQFYDQSINKINDGHIFVCGDNEE